MSSRVYVFFLTKIYTVKLNITTLPSLTVKKKKEEKEMQCYKLCSIISVQNGLTLRVSSTFEFAQIKICEFQLVWRFTG